MRKFQTVLFAMLAVSALGAIIASSAFGETTLLAEWLANGAEITANLATTSTGSLLLEDTETIAGKAAVLCEGIFIGTVGANGKDETTEVQNLAKEKIGVLGGLALKCVAETGCAAATEASPIEVWPVGLPWKTELFLMENGTFLDLVSATEVGYELLCLVLGINAEDKCTGTDGEVEIVNDADTGDAAIPALAEVTPKFKCTQSGGKETGVNVADELTPLLLVSGELLTVSSV
jgi:hypothetical protein